MNNKYIEELSWIPYIIKNQYLTNRRLVTKVRCGLFKSFPLILIDDTDYKSLTINTEQTKSRKEIVENNINGFIFDVKENEAITVKLIKNTSRLIEDNDLRNDMSEECLRSIREGKFSVKERNNKLNRIYEEVK